MYAFLGYIVMEAKYSHFMCHNVQNGDHCSLTLNFSAKIDMHTLSIEFFLIIVYIKFLGYLWSIKQGQLRGYFGSNGQWLKKSIWYKLFKLHTMINILLYKEHGTKSNFWVTWFKRSNFPIAWSSVTFHDHNSHANALSWDLPRSIVS